MGRQRINGLGTIMNRPGVLSDSGLFFCIYPISRPKNTARRMVCGMEDFRLNSGFQIDVKQVAGVFGPGSA